MKDESKKTICILVTIFFILITNCFGIENKSISLFESLKKNSQEKNWRTLTYEVFGASNYGIIVKSFNNEQGELIYTTSLEIEKYKLNSNKLRLMTYDYLDDLVFSPDATKIAFWIRKQSYDMKKEVNILYIIDSNGKDLDKILEVEYANGLCWSYDKKYIAFIGKRKKNDSELKMISLKDEASRQGEHKSIQASVSLFIVNLESSICKEIVKYTPAFIYSQCWSPDGVELAYGTQSSAIMIYNFNDRSTRILVNGSFPAWSPKGDWIAYMDNSSGDFFIISKDGKTKELLIKNKKISFLNALSISSHGSIRGPMLWSPNGEYLLYGRSSGLEGEFLTPFILELSTRKEEQLPENSCGLISFAGQK